MLVHPVAMTVAFREKPSYFQDELPIKTPRAARVAIY
jgi:hypothetical protein